MKRQVLTTLLLVTLGSGVLPAQSTRSTPQLGKNTIQEVIAAMTVEEKVKLVVGIGGEPIVPGLPAMDPEDKKIPNRVPGASGRMHPVPRLGIPALVLADGPAGVRIEPTRGDDKSRTYYATGFPVATLLASSWDTALLRRVGAAFGEEAREYGIDIILAPGMNLHRNPLGGRNFEYYSEDPVISGRIAAAFVTGLQSIGVGTSIKHFAANNEEANRFQSNSIISQRALREIYLKSFEIAVKESQPWTVMSSYNLINGTYTSQDPELLKTVLRDEWGYRGVVVSDWGAGNDPAAKLKAGNDIIMPGDVEKEQAILKSVREGTLSEKQLDENVERVLRLVLLSPTFKKYKYSEKPNLTKNAQVAREAAAEGMVLLKNDGGTLPMAAKKKIALFGIGSYELSAGGTGSGDVNKAYTISLEQGLASAGFQLDSAQKETYTRYIEEQKKIRPKPALFFLPLAPLPEMPLENTIAEQQAAEADVALVTIGRSSGETGDRKVDGDFNLTAAERDLITKVSDAFHARGKKVVVVLNIGGVMEIASWRDRVDSILLAWQPGQEGGNSIADILSGKVNPSGKLPTTFPVRYEDVPSSKNFPGKEIPGAEMLIKTQCVPCAFIIGKPAEAIYEEGIYVGYRYYDTFNVQPAYEFGYGLSYTDFAYSDLKLSSEHFPGKLSATVTVTNTGQVPGREVVQLYVSAPSGRLDKPASELRSFAKTRLLRPGQSEKLSFTLMPTDLASFDTSTSSWIMEPGPYTVKVGTSSRKTKQSQKFNLTKELLVSRTKAVLQPQVRINELRPNR